jgi:hypothetical protein
MWEKAVMPVWIGRPERPGPRRLFRVGVAVVVLSLLTGTLYILSEPTTQTHHPARLARVMEDVSSDVTAPEGRVREIRPLVVVMRDMSSGVTVREGRSKDTPELVVDPFPDEPGESRNTEERRR